MESPIHRLSDLFRQLGLPDEPPAMEAFTASHRPLPQGISLADVKFWTASQAQFLREEISKDADWAELMDTLASHIS